MKITAVRPSVPPEHPNHAGIVAHLASVPPEGWTVLAEGENCEITAVEIDALYDDGPFTNVGAALVLPLDVDGVTTLTQVVFAPLSALSIGIYLARVGVAQLIGVEGVARIIAAGADMDAVAASMHASLFPNQTAMVEAGPDATVIPSTGGAE